MILGPTEKLTAYFKTSFTVGFVIAAPFMLHQLWLFLRPGLKPHERRFILLLIPTSTALFLVGVAFIYFIMMPTALQYMMGIDLGVEINARITLDRYFSFMLFLILAGGLVFQIPLVTYFLARMGLVTSQGMAKNRKIAIVGTVILAAILTPTGDPFNLFLLAVPIYLLYEISIFIAAMTYRKSGEET